MKCRIVLAEEQLSVLREKMLAGWILLFGPGKILSIVEENCYPPGTKESADFETLSWMTRKGYVWHALVLPNERLKSLSGGTDFSTTIVLTAIAGLGSHQYLFQTTEYKESREKAVESFLKDCYKPWMDDLDGIKEGAS